MVASRESLAEYEELVSVPRAAVQFPLELPVPDGFIADALETWPKVEGRLEYVAGRLLFMPPTGQLQQDTCADVAGVLMAWRRHHRQFRVGANKAGMLLDGDVRGADAAVWRSSEADVETNQVRRRPPILAVDVAGRDDTEASLRAKAAWYLSVGVSVVWLLFPADRRVVVLAAGLDVELGAGDSVPAHAELPGLEPSVGELFEQVSSS